MEITVFGTQGATMAGPDDLPALLADGQTCFWVDMTGPTAANLAVLEETFHFHPLAIEDTHNQQQLPKVEIYDDILFAILNAITTEAGTSIIRELDVFVGPNYLVTVHETAEPVVSEALQRVRRTPEHLAVSANHLFYVLADALVDRIFPVMEALEDRSETLSDEILTRPDQTALNQLFALKRQAAEIWRLVWIQREMLSDLARDWDIAGRQDDLHYYMRDVVDHLTLLADMMSVQRDTITSLIDLYMSATSNRLNTVVNRLTVITIAIGMLTVFSGFYGMNFNHTWPPFDAWWGVPLVLGLMVGVVTLLLREFRRREWF